MDKFKQLEELRKESDLQIIIDKAFAILNNPLVLFDTSYNLLVRAKGITSDDPITNEILESGKFSHKTVDFFNNEKFILSFAQSDTVALMQSDKLPYDRMNVKVFDKDNIQVANVSIVASNEPFKDGDMKLAELLSDILSQKMCENPKYYEKVSRVYKENLPFDLIRSGATADYAWIENALKRTNYLAVVDIAQYDPTLTHLAYFKDKFQNIQPEFLYFVDLNSVIIIISIDDDIIRPLRQLKKLNKFFAENSLFAGISSKFSNVGEIKKCYSEAIFALNHGLTSRRVNENIFQFDNYKIDYFAKNAGIDSEYSQTSSPAVELIREYDEKNKTELLKTLYCYLINGKDKQLTAQSLGISNHELRQQVRMMVKKFAVDFKNGNQLFNIYVCLKIVLNVWID